MYVLGIDGGGTKTKAVISNTDGEIFAEATVGPTNPISIPEADLYRELASLVDLLKEKNKAAFSNLEMVYAGMSGVDHVETRRRMQDLLVSLFPTNVQVKVNNDAITALYSGTLGEPGIVQIAGTGSITYGLNENGEINRVGGWGYLLGERGSGYSLGSDALVAAFDTHDLLGEETLLYHFLCEHFNVDVLPEIIHNVYQDKNVKELIAGLGRIVFQAADQGDAKALEIIHRNAVYMGEAIACLINKLFDGKKAEVPVVLTGGLYHRFDLFQQTMEDVIEKNNKNVRLILPKIEPVGGAVIASLKEQSIPVRETFVDRFSNTR